jgi:eukaryotic-like serine/threonine-protein kinase
MTEHDRRLQALVAGVADGLPVDWRLAESTAESDEERSVVRQLSVLATVAGLHRATEEPLTGAAEGEPATGSLPLPDRWGPLEIRELVGSGGYGTVYRAWDPRLAREVALKLLSNERAGHETFQQSVVAEGRLLARVRHQNVIAVYGADTHDGRVGFWMEFLEGQTLKQWLDEHGRMNSREATLIGIDVARALAAVHASGLVHRDVKAQNVMREAGGRTVLMDFGTGVETGHVAGLAGTPLYMAPEVLVGEPATPASDIYSVGVLLFYLVSGEFPVSGPSIDAIREAHGNHLRRLLRDVRPDLPAAFVRVVERALSEAPRARPATSGLLEAELAASLELPGDGLTRPAGPSGLVPFARRRRRLMAGLGTAVIVAVLWAGHVWTRVAHYVSPPPNTIQSLAILPLQNLGGVEQDYFADGMTDLLTTNLSKLKALKIISNSSMVGYKKTSQPLSQLGRDLGVDAVVRGSVLRDGDRLRVTAQLISTRDGSSLWAETYERNVRDAFTLESDLAKDIARGVNLTLTPQEQQHLSVAGPGNPEAQDEYLKGYTALARFTADGAAEAAEHFENAIRLDPRYAQAYSSAAYAYMLLGGYGRAEQDTVSKARFAALKALALDDSQSAAHWVLGVLQFNYDWDWLGAEASFKQALELDPNNANAQEEYGWYLAARGDLPQALAHMQRARVLDPLQFTRRSTLAAVLYYLKRYDEALVELKAALAVDPDYETANFVLGRVYSAKGMVPEALAEMERPTARHELRFRAELARVYIQAGQVSRGRALLDTLEAEASHDSNSRDWYALAFVHAALGETGRAFDLLDRAVAERSPDALWLKVDPRFDSMRSDPRFSRVIERLGL